MCFTLKVKLLHLHMHIVCPLAIFRNLGMTADVFEYAQKNIPFVTGCGDRNFVDFSMLITWISGREDPTERNH